MGAVEKVTVFEGSPEGVVSVKFRLPGPAAKVLLIGFLVSKGVCWRQCVAD